MAEREMHAQCAGCTLSVPNVQALATSLDKSSMIPERYVRPEYEADLVAHTNEVELPVIDLAKLIDPEFTEEEATKLHSTCKEWGFFQVSFLI
jgi:non-haem dioxygenase in morphine synthesis N-terminal